MMHLRVFLLAVLLIGLCSPTVQAFTTPPVIDACTRVENPLASGWAGTFDPDFTQIFQANGTVCTTLAGGQAVTYWNTVQPANQIISATVSDGTTTSTNGISLWVGLQQPSASVQTVDGYRCHWAPAVPTYAILRTLNGSGGTQLGGGPFTGATTTGDQIACQKIGSTISLWQDSGAGWELLMSVVDTSIDNTVPSYVGLGLSSNSLSVDEIRVGEVLGTPMGITYTQEEVELWIDRAANGPYRIAGDVSTNSPGDWTRILANANAFLVDPAPKESHWTGQTAATCVQADDTAAPEVDRRMGDTLRDAAFAWLITGTTTYRDAAKAELLAQAAEVGTNFADSTRWCVAPAGFTNPFFDIAHWFTKLFLTYDYLRPALLPGGSAPDSSAVSTLDAWFLNAAIFWEAVVQDEIGSRYAVSARTGLIDPTDFALSGGGTSNAGTVFLGYHYCGGTRSNLLSGKYTNRANSLALAFSLPAVLLEQSALQLKAKRYFMEALIYATWSSGIYEDYNRITVGVPQQGVAYASDAIGMLGLIANVFARQGDRSLVDLQTSTGAGIDTTAGGPKSLQLLMTTLANYTNYTPLQYGLNQASPCSGTLDQRLGVESSTFHSNRDTFMAPLNGYYQSISGTNNTRSQYTRTSSGAPAYCSTCDSGGYEVWGGPSGMLPGVLFMYGQTEGLVWPYTIEGALTPVPMPGILLLPAPTQVGSVRGGGTLQGGTRQ